MTPTEHATTSPAWAKWWLRAAGVYNLAWGGVVIAFPHLLFDAVGIPRMNYPAIWQCVGMIVGVYGVGYLAAAAKKRIGGSGPARLPASTASRFNGTCRAFRANPIPPSPSGPRISGPEPRGAGVGLRASPGWWPG